MLRKQLPAVLLACLLLAGCGTASTDSDSSLAASQAASTEPLQKTVFAMDTVMELSVYGGSQALLQQGEERILQLEGLFSVTEDTSEIAQLNQNGTATLSPDTAELLERTLDLCADTNGALDVSIYPVVRDWGFTTGDYKIPTQTELDALLENVDYTQVKLSGTTASIPQGMLVDLGSTAKGYTGEQLAQLFREAGVTSALLNLGGNVQTVGQKPDGSDWRVAVQDPESDAYLGVVTVADEAVITSGGYERYFTGEDGEIYWHIMDPATGKPAHNGLISATIIGPSGTVCDALSTSLFVMGLDKAAEYWQTHDSFEVILIGEDGTVYITEGLENRFTLADAYADRPLRVITHD